MGPINAFFTGIRRALACWPAWVILFLATFLTAVPLALFPAGSLLETARRTVIADMTSGFKTWQILDAVRLSLTGVPIADQPGLSDALVTQNMVYLVLLAALLPLLGGFVSAFFWGGVLVTYRDAGAGESGAPGPDAVVQTESSPARAAFRLGRFLWGCWHWFGSFLLLGVIQAGLILGISLLLFAMQAALSALGEAGSLISLVIILLFAGLWLAVFELARVQCVVANTRNIFTGFGRALHLIFNRMPQVIAFYILALLALLLVHLVFRAGLMPRIPAQAVLVTLVVQQVFILARLFALALRLAGLTVIAQAYASLRSGSLVEGQQAYIHPVDERPQELTL